VVTEEEKISIAEKGPNFYHKGKSIRDAPLFSKKKKTEQDTRSFSPEKRRRSMSKDAFLLDLEMYSIDGAGGEGNCPVVLSLTVT